MKIVNLTWIFIGCLFWNKVRVLLALKLTELKIDKHTVRGNGTVLECKFDLEGETLYAVKWYKDANEFYRYLPKEEPQIQIFDVPGVHVDMRHSEYNEMHTSQVHLNALDLTSSGRYRCEVSGEAPSFTTVSEYGDMVTIALPADGPKITGGKPRYRVGETVDVNCTSGTSKPAATLQWYINGEQVNASFLRGPTREYIGREGMETVTLGLRFKIQEEHFQNGNEDMKLKCLATISPVYWKTNEESVLGVKQDRQRVPTLPVTIDDDDENDKSRADRVRASNACRKCNWYLINLLSLQLFVVPWMAIR